MKIFQITKLLLVLLLGASGIAFGMKPNKNPAGLRSERKYYDERGKPGFRGNYRVPTALNVYADPIEEYEEYSEDPDADDSEYSYEFINYH
jgi:hypothetical protein